tara:strand:+ start:476 stop:679 length:204 start_codon:yes stop_codon:yes gene_type:complete
VLRKMNIKIETVITILVMIIGVGVAYGSITTRVANLEDKTDMILQMSIDISVIKEKVSNIEEKINNQ